MKEFQSHCGQFYEMREKNSPKVGRENNYLLTKGWDVLTDFLPYHCLLFKVVVKSIT